VNPKFWALYAGSSAGQGEQAARFHAAGLGQVLESRTGRSIPKMPVDRLVETRKENGAGNDRNPARDRRMTT